VSGAGYLDDDVVGRAYDHRLMRRLLRYLRPSARLVTLAVLLLILFSLASLAGPIITRIAIDDHIVPGDYHGLVGLCFLWLGLIVAAAALEYAQIVIMNLIGQRAMLRLRDQLYDHVQRLPIAFFDRNPVGRLMTRLTNDVEVLNQMFTQGVVAIFGDVFTLAGIMAVLVVMNWKLALVALSSLPALFLISMQFRDRVRAAFRDIRAALARINSYLQEMLQGIPVIKALRREEKNRSEFDELNRAHLSAFLRSVRAFSVYYPLVELIESVAIALILWYGGARVLGGELTFGALVAFIQYVGRFFRPIRDLTDKYNILQDAMASSERIFKLLDEPEDPDVDDKAVAAFDPRGTIRFEDVHFAYDDRAPVLAGVSFEIPSGKTTAIVGSTGAGKTTLISLLGRFYDPGRGRITIGGIDIAAVPRRTLRRHMAIVQQDVFLFSGTIEENIRLGEESMARERIERAVRLSHADRLISRFEQGLQGPVTERGSSFSTGERQLLAFARALTFEPDILILDEATASVDSETEALIQDALRALLQNRTAVVIAHRLSTIRNADQIVVLHHGRIAERGRHRELLAANGIYARLYRLQFQMTDPEESAEPRMRTSPR
jgi:ATP-binding cassette subfamily B protein